MSSVWSVSSRGLSFPAGFFVSPPGLPTLFGAGLAPGLTGMALLLQSRHSLSMAGVYQEETFLKWMGSPGLRRAAVTRLGPTS